MHIGFTGAWCCYKYNLCYHDEEKGLLRTFYFNNDCSPGNCSCDYSDGWK